MRQQAGKFWLTPNYRLPSNLDAEISLCLLMPRLEVEDRYDLEAASLRRMQT